MKEPDWKNCTEKQLWEYVATHLAKNGIDTILVGGAVVAIYTDGLYRSGDLDFVQLTYLDKNLPQIMKKIGFEVRESRHYSHPRCKHLIVDFASGPLGIGDDVAIIPAEQTIDGTVIKIYSPTDCIRDRLASYIHFGALECLDQAVLVAQKHPYDRNTVQRWCAKEGSLEAFKAFEKTLKKQKGLGRKHHAKENKNLPKPSPDIKAHPWRPCPLGKHWVRAHPRNRVSSKGKPYTQHVPGLCRTGSSHLDHLYIDEIHEVAAQHFSELKGPPSSNPITFGPAGKEYDELIRGWTQYWNDVLKPSEPLDADVVKALIASESGFNPNAWNHRRGKNGAYGLMQVLNSSVQLLKDPKELNNHFVDLTSADMKDPNLSICAGVRWLFRKKQLQEARIKKTISWRDAVAAYKNLSPNEKTLMPRFDGYYSQLKGKK